MPQRKKPQARKAAPARKMTSSTSKSQVNTQRLAQAAKNANFVPRAKAPAKPVAKQAPASTFQGAILAKKQELRGTHVYVLSVPYEAQYLMRGLGAQYHPVLKVHIYEGLKLPAQLLPYRSEEYSLERWIEDDLNGKVTANVTPPKMKPRSHQITAVKKISSSAKTGWRGFVLADNVGLGKAQPLDSLVLTKAGYKRMGDIQVGDELINPEGEESLVKNIYPQGIRPVYKIIFSDNTEVLADENHIWWVRNHNNGNYGKEKFWGIPKTTKEILNDMEWNNGTSKWHIDTPNPVDFSSEFKKPLSIHPYLLGALLGDGSFSKNGIRFTTADNEIIEILQAISPENIYLKKKTRSKYDYSFICYKDSQKQGNYLVRELDKLKLLETRSHDKFIPSLFLHSSIQDRVSLLQGLLDTDGTIFPDGNALSFTSKSEQLAKDTAWLVRSLGGIAKIRKINKKWNYKGTLKEGLYYYVAIHLPQDIQPFKLTRKAKLVRERTKYITPRKTIRSILFVGNMETQCISVTHKNKLYITDNFTVTHNTAEAGWGAALAAKAKNFTPQNPAKLLIVSPKSVIPHWRNTLHSIGIENVRAVVINYDQAKKLLDSPASASNVKKTVTANRHTMLKGRPTIGWDIIIADESHKLKNESQRSIAFGNIARYQVTADKAPFVIWTSATVGQTPLELGYLAPLIGQMVGLPTLTTDQWGDWLIANHFNVKKSKAGNFSWIQVKPDMTQSEKEFVLKQQRKDIDRLSELIFGDNSPSIRRNPEDIAGWPSQTYMATPLELSQEGKRLYEEAWNEFRKYIGLHPRGKNPSGGLAATMRFRQKASLLSAISTAEFVNDLLDNGLQVAVSVEFMETIDVMRDYLLKKGWHVAEFSGRNTDAREQERLRFQRGEAQVILFSVLEGINLHANEMLISGQKASSAKRAMVVHDIRYSAIDMTQIIGRTTRDGELAMAYLMFTEGTIEARILQVVLERVKNVKSLSGDDDGTLEVVQDLLDGLGR